MWRVHALESGMTVLLAKSSLGGREKTLSGHVRDDLAAFDAMFGSLDHPTALAKDWLHFFRLKPTYHTKFWRNTVAAIVFHDLGKANDGFQNALQRQGSQAVRHEYLSAFLLTLPKVEEWISSTLGLDLDLVLSAIIGHHLKAGPDEICSMMGDRQIVQFYGDHEDVQSLFAMLADHFDISTPSFELPIQWCFEGDGESIPDHADRLTRRFGKLKQVLKRDEAYRPLLLAIKAAVIAVDSAGSGFAREGYDIHGWVAGLFDHRARLDGSYIEQYVLAPRIRQIKERHGNAFSYHGFQDRAATMPDRTLMIAPCGAGKTLAAWRWIQARLAERPRGRVIFLYPTRATATEGFRDYVANAPESDAALATGTAAYELRDMFSNPDDSRKGEDYLTEARLYALGYWNKRLFSATVDQFLSFMQQCYKGLCLLPVLADAVVVFDEVHSFDVGLFDAFVKFLKHFDLPVLAMTASLPSGRRQALEGEGLHLFTGAGLKDLEANAGLERYEVVAIDDAQVAEQEVRAALERHEKVLWVVNTVDRAQSLAQQLRDLDPLCYHSRFTLDDRKDRHKQVVATFQERVPQGRLAITTQVCEMSLDLDARLLVSEHAPIPSIIQRMGRCNRHARPGDNMPGRVLFYPGESHVPYKPDEMAPVRAFIAEISGSRVSQARLEELLERFTQCQGRESNRWTAFLDDGPWASDVHCDELRDTDERSTQAVLDSAINDFLAAQHAKAPTDGFILPVPQKFGSPDGRLPRHLKCAAGTHYDPYLGFLKQPISNSQGGGR